LKDTEFIFPRVTHNPEVKSSFLLVIPPCGTERFQAPDFTLDVIGLQVKMHPLFRNLLIVCLLQQDCYLGIRKAKMPVDPTAYRRQGLINGVECLSPESDTTVKV
jgi:hypothetical protein